MRVEMPSGAPFVVVTRNGRIESMHAVAACAADASGGVQLTMGDVDVPVFLRSAAKPFIAATIVLSGAADRFDFDDRELAVITASHNGEPFHVECVRGILQKIGRSESDLQCGAHPPYEPAAKELAAAGQTPTAVHNNCSGKHAGILALCSVLGADHATYLEPANPAQRHILDFCARMVGDDPETWPIGVDGCGIPVFATPLRKAARAFARLATLEGIDEADARALARVRSAVVAQPAYLAGTARFDTDLIVASQGEVVGKAGAEGVHGDALVSRRLGLALKVVDGTRRAATPAVIALLEELGALDEAAVSSLAGYARPPVRNVAGRVVGGIDILREAASAAHRPSIDTIAAARASL
jgi:L-asparaginase II